MNEQLILRGDSGTPSFSPHNSEAFYGQGGVASGVAESMANTVAALRNFYQLRLQGENESVAPRRALIAGDVERGYQLARKLKQHFPRHYDVVGFVTPNPDAVSPNGIPVVGSLEKLGELAQNYQVDDVFVADFLVPEFGDIKEEIAAQTEHLRQPISVPANAASRWYWPIKRVCDFLFALSFLLLSAPLMLLTALLVKLTSRGPILFGQERVGLNGESFTIYKFRTMRVDAEAQTGPILARRKDNRCTPIGGFLRATKIDELPQLFNVLKGEMSIVGPRPERPCFVNIYREYVPSYMNRHNVLPGLTGLAQLSGDHLIHVNVKLHYDLVYVCNYSPWMDAKLLLQTPFSILKAMLKRSADC